MQIIRCDISNVANLSALNCELSSTQFLKTVGKLVDLLPAQPQTNELFLFRDYTPNYDSVSLNFFNVARCSSSEV
jgi:hypothetical protein